MTTSELDVGLGWVHVRTYVYKYHRGTFLGLVDYINELLRISSGLLINIVYKYVKQYLLKRITTNQPSDHSLILAGGLKSY